MNIYRKTYLEEVAERAELASSQRRAMARKAAAEEALRAMPESKPARVKRAKERPQMKPQKAAKSIDECISVLNKYGL